jgi:hypothetical protein
MDQLKSLYSYLKKQKNKKIVFLTTSTRWEGEPELPKSSIIADELATRLDNCQVINVSKLKIFACEGNVSSKKGNHCGVKSSKLDNDSIIQPAISDVGHQSIISQTKCIKLQMQSLNLI